MRKSPKCELDFLTRECVRCWSTKPYHTPMRTSRWQRLLELRLGRHYKEWSDPAYRRFVRALLLASGRTDFPHITGSDD